MRRANWNREKDATLEAEYGFGFERILTALAEGSLLDDRTHPNVEKYGHQRQLVVEIESYAWVVPYVEDGEEIFLKTFFPGRKATKEYLGRADEK